MTSLNTEGFIWDRLRDYFPYGDISLREGNYERLVTRILDLLPSAEEQTILLALLDAQACVLLEQVWVQEEQSRRRGLKATLDGHFISAWLAINGNFRSERHLSGGDAWLAMLNLPAGEMLADLIVKATGSRK